MKICFFIILIISIYILLIDGKRNYLLEIERGNLTYYNKDYGKNVKFDYKKLNKSHIIVSASFDVIRNDVKSDAVFGGEAFRLVNNEWKKIKVPDFYVNICDMFHQNSYLVGLKELMKHGNVTPCGVTASHYYVKDYIPDIDFPPIVPAGKYLGRGIIKLKNLEMFKMEWYATLTRL